jgi:hypothetical protein
MDKISELNKKLEHGDLKWIARQTVTPYETVQKIFSGKRSADTAKGRRLQKAAELLIMSREQAKKQLNKK